MRGRRVLLLCAMTISKNIRGFCFALLGGISWGFSGACAQYLFHHYNVDPLWVSSVRMLCAGIVLCAFALAIARGPFLAMWRNRSTVASLVIFSVFGLASCQITYLLAIQNSNAGTATVIQYIAPVLVVLYLCVRSHRRPLKREVLAIALVMMGTFLVATHGNPNSLALTPAGLFWSLVSAVTYAMYTLIPRRLMLHYGSVPVVAGALLIGGIMLSIVLQSWTVNPGFDFSGWLLLFFWLGAVWHHHRFYVVFPSGQRHWCNENRHCGQHRNGFGNFVRGAVVGNLVQLDRHCWFCIHHGYGIRSREAPWRWRHQI